MLRLSESLVVRRRAERWPRLGLVLLLASPCMAQDPASQAILPPAPPWRGRSEALVLPPDHAWITPAEKSGFQSTPRYEETLAYVRRLASASPQLRLITLGRSPEGREIWMVVASKERAFTPAALRATGKPTLLAHSAIHAGEMDGKDAGLMLLRDMTVLGKKKDLLDRANLLFVPILSVDGHERFSRFSRINQRGPAEAGWRTTARNLNLNREFAKLDAPEIRAIVRALDSWDPDLYLDLHVTDGMDFQYDITYSFNGPHSWSPSIARWLETAWVPAVTKDLEAMGHIPGAYLWLKEDSDPAQGVRDDTSTIRYSEGYGNARHLPSVLIEGHSLKPYRQRVLGTYVLLESSLRLLGSSAPTLRRAVAEDRARRPAEVPLEWKASDTPTELTFKGIRYRVSDSRLTGGKRIEWTGEPADLTLPIHRFNVVRTAAKRPVAYWIPAAAADVIERLSAHGIRFERIATPREVEVELDRLSDVTFAKEVTEDRLRVTAKAVPERRRERYAAGSVRVPTDQPLGTLAVLLLEPTSPDSFFQWGLFHWTLQRAEYVDSYVMEPMAERMLAGDPALRAEFEKWLSAGPASKRTAAERLDWFYSRTPFFDGRWLLYPVGRELPGT